MTRRAMWILAMGALLAGGCGGDDTETKDAKLGQEYGALTRLRSVAHKGLRDELARIEAESGTPEQLDQTGVAKENNVADALAKLFPPRRFPTDKLRSLAQQSEQIFPVGRFDFNPQALEKVVKFGKKYESQRAGARNALKLPQCDFAILHMAGPLADTVFIDIVQISVRLEAFRAAEMLTTENNPYEAVISLRHMLRLISHLAAEKQVVARLEAAYLRREAFVVLKAIVSHDDTTPRHVEKLAEMVREHMKAWTVDADAWIGDRALGMCIYEMARDGSLPLTPDEEAQFRKDGTLKILGGMSPKRLNVDEIFYLDTMRKIIEACKRPYYTRLEQFDQIEEDLHERRNSYEFPIIAARLLLPGIQEAQATQAQDRANWEVWSLALEWATGRELPAYEFNPLTGNRYEKDKETQQPTRSGRPRTVIKIWNFGSGKDGDRPIIRLPVRE